MRTSVRSLFAAAALLCVFCAAHPIWSQTYTPKAIRFEGSQGLDPAELLRLSGLRQGVPLTKAEIEAGLQKLADSGSFTDLNYTVNDAALVVKLTSAAGNQVLPVRFANLPWWTSDELMKLLEARVPLFHGELPLTGTLTDQVQAALVTLLVEKGIAGAQVTAMQSTSHPGGAVDHIALSLSSPDVVIGDTKFDGAVPAISAKLDAFGRGISGEFFDSTATAQSLLQTTSEICEDAGFLDVHTDDPVYSAPRKVHDHYVVDQEVTVHPGELYRIGSIVLQPAVPVSEGELRHALTLKAGDPASASALRVAQLQLAQPYVQRAYLLAGATVVVNKDPASHTATYLVAFSPGSQFHFGSVDTTSLPAGLQAEFAKTWHATRGALVDQAFMSDLRQAVRGLHAPGLIVPNERLQSSDHTVTIVLKLQTAGMTHS